MDKLYRSPPLPVLLKYGVRGYGGYISYSHWNQPFRNTHQVSCIFTLFIYLLITEYQNQFLDQLNGS